MAQLAGYNDDTFLWNEFKAGDKTCFNTLFRRYYSELYYYGIKNFSDPDLVKECIQEVFIRIWETRESLGNVENVRAYLIVSLRRIILAQKKKVMLQQHIGLRQVENSPFLFDLNEFEKHEEISDGVRKILLAAINSLTRKQRELVMLFFYYELSYAEIAEVIGITVPALRNLMYRTLIHLRESIGEKSLESMNKLFFLFFSSFSVKKV